MISKSILVIKNDINIKAFTLWCKGGSYNSFMCEWQQMVTTFCQKLKKMDDILLTIG